MHRGSVATGGVGRVRKGNVMAYRKVRTWLLLAFSLVLALSACGSKGLFEKTELYLEEQPGVDGPRDANASIESAGWHRVGPNVWRNEIVYPGGGVSTSYRGAGTDGLLWLAENVWRVRYEALLQEYSNTQDGPRMDRILFEIEGLSRRLEVADQWRRRVDQAPAISPRCAPSAFTFSLPTDLATGAQSYSSALTCASGELGHGWASAWTQSQGGDSAFYSKPPGVSGSGGMARYGYPCQSDAFASGYPEFHDTNFEC